MPAEIAGGVGLKLEYALRDEIEVAAGPLPVRDTLNEHLWRNDEEHADDGWHQQTQRAFSHECGSGTPPQGEPQSGTRDDEQQRHAQPVREIHGPLQTRDRLSVLNVPTPADEQHAGVEKQQHENCDDTQPIQKFVARVEVAWFMGRSSRDRVIPLKMWRRTSEVSACFT
jgi:hypothetical protein